MTERAKAPVGAPCWIELYTSDIDRARAFYGEVFGWEAEDPAEEFGGYVNFTKGGVRVAGCMSAQPDMGAPNVWSTYLASEDAARTAEAVEANGGHVVLPPMAVADLGTFAVFTDPSGASVGTWQPGTHQGFGIVGEHGAPSWFELQTRDHDRAVAFYRDSFGLETTTPPGMTGYTILCHGDDWYGGVMDAGASLPEGAPSTWLVYFGVDDTDAALADIERLGGAVLEPAEDTPYGRLAAAADPMGTRFKLVAPNEAMPSRD